MDKFKSMLTKPWMSYLVALLAMGGAALTVSVVPRSLFAFLFFIGSVLLVYYLPLSTKAKLFFVLIGTLVLMPIIGSFNLYYMNVATQVGIYVALALGLNIVVGFAGLLDLGYVAFYATGAYIYAIFASDQAGNFIHFAKFPLAGEWFWVFLPLSLLAAGITGILLGLPALRLRGDYLAIVTLGFGEIIRIIFNNLDKPVNITNGPKGITPIQPPALFGFTLNKPIYYYFIVMGIVFFVIFVTRRLEHSRIGRAWAAIREDEVAARAMGIPLLRTKLMAFAIGASFAGMMGVVFAAKQTFIDPSSFTFMESIGVLAMVILGGMGSIPGAIVGATAVVMLQSQVLKSFSEFLAQLRDSGILNIPTQLEPAKFERLVFGLILVVMMIFRPQGLIPAKRREMELLEEKADRPAKGEES
ncbi:MAG: branched-chain amino acid ABC transporter permease [Firmicutes bacterium]|nr:branched-chain amino acid ABC transporter permease [Bacillota bacterium]